jgi:hypothetical protein
MLVNEKLIARKLKKRISDARLGQPRAEGAGKSSQKIEVFDFEEKTTTSYNSKSEAARALNIHKSVIDLYFIRN